MKYIILAFVVSWALIKVLNFLPSLSRNYNNFSLLDQDEASSGAFSDMGTLSVGTSRWWGYSGGSHFAIAKITDETIEFNVRILGLLKKTWSFHRNDIYSMERKRGWWIIKNGFIIEHKKDNYPMYMCYTTWRFNRLREEMIKCGWPIKDIGNA